MNDNLQSWGNPEKFGYARTGILQVLNLGFMFLVVAGDLWVVRFGGPFRGDGAGTTLLTLTSTQLHASWLYNVIFG